jgi:hypothetical protein
MSSETPPYDLKADVWSAGPGAERIMLDVRAGAEATEVQPTKGRLISMLGGSFGSSAAQIDDGVARLGLYRMRR